MSSKNARVNKKNNIKTGKTIDAHDTDMTAMDIDADWFRTHPGRSHRVRRALLGELLGPLEGEGYVVVRQIIPELRVRVRFSTTVGLPDEDPSEPIAHSIFDLIQENPGQCVSVPELYGRLYVFSVLSGGESGTIH